MRTFDAFGKARDNKGLDTLDGRLFANNPNGKRNRNRKGFTGHEHLDEAGLIHTEAPDKQKRRTRTNRSAGQQKRRTRAFSSHLAQTWRQPKTCRHLIHPLT